MLLMVDVLVVSEAEEDFDIVLNSEGSESLAVFLHSDSMVGYP